MRFATLAVAAVCDQLRKVKSVPGVYRLTSAAASGSPLQGRVRCQHFFEIDTDSKAVECLKYHQTRPLIEELCGLLSMYFYNAYLDAVEPRSTSGCNEDMREKIVVFLTIVILYANPRLLISLRYMQHDDHFCKGHNKKRLSLSKRMSNIHIQYFHILNTVCFLKYPCTTT